MFEERKGRGKDRNAKGNRRDKRDNKENSEWQDKVVSLRRVAKVTSGGKKFRFSAVVVVGNGKGKVGLGFGKANELVDAIRKAKDKAIKTAVTVQIKGSTIPHEVLGKFKSGEIMMKPASEGTGVIAGGAVRPVLELVGIKDVLTKSLRSTNPVNLVRATLSGLSDLYDIKDIAKKRGMTVGELFGTTSDGVVE